MISCECDKRCRVHVVYTDRLITQYSTQTGKINIRRRKYACYVRTFKNVLFYWSLDKGRGHNKLLELGNQTSIYANREYCSVTVPLIAPLFYYKM